MKRTWIPRDEEAIEKERVKWGFRSSWNALRYKGHPDIHRPRHMSIPEDNDFYEKGGD